MSDTTDIDPTSTPDLTTDSDVDPLDDTSSIEDTEKTTGRAAGLRARAQDAEAARDAALALVEALRQREAERLAETKLAAVADLWEYGTVSPADLTDDAGLIDPAKVDAAVDELLEARPGLAKSELRRPTPGSYADQGQFRTGRVAGKRKTWADMF